PTPANPDHLPIGFTRRFEPAIGDYVLDVTCAACHSGELHVTNNGQRTAIRIDGGQAMHALTDMQRGSFATELLAADVNTGASPCAACHSGGLHVTHNDQRTAIRIDGGQAMHALTDMQRGSFAPELLAAVVNTAASPWKFDRFARKVLKDDYPQGKKALKRGLRASVFAMLGAGQNNPLRGLYPVREGFGRTDALGRIGNTVFGDHLV